MRGDGHGSWAHCDRCHGVHVVPFSQLRIVHNRQRQNGSIIDLENATWLHCRCLITLRVTDDTTTRRNHTRPFVLHDSVAHVHEALLIAARNNVVLDGTGFEYGLRVERIDTITGNDV